MPSYGHAKLCLVFISCVSLLKEHPPKNEYLAALLHANQSYHINQKIQQVR